MAILCGVIMVICLILAAFTTEEETCMGFAGFFALATFGLVIICGSLLFRCHHILPGKIAMYEEENAKIEQMVTGTVENYMEFEKGIIYQVADDESAIELVSLYPTLSSDTLVSNQIQLYIDNNKKIKALKESQLNEPIYKFLLYFGH